MVRGSTQVSMTGFRARALSRPHEVSRTLRCSTPTPAPKSTPAAVEIANFLIDLAKRQNPAFDFHRSTLLKDVPDLDLRRLSNQFINKNSWGFAQNWQANVNQSFIENAHVIHDLMTGAATVDAFGDAVPTSASRAATGKVFEKTFHPRKGEETVILKFQPRGFKSEQDLAEVVIHLNLTFEQAEQLAKDTHPVDVLLISSTEKPGKETKVRKKTFKEPDRVQIKYAISPHGWKRPNFLYLSIKSFFSALAWPLSMFAFRPRISWPKGMFEKSFSYIKE